MELFEEIYREAMLLRLQEARALNSIEEIYRALKKDASGRRYIETLLNGKKNLPEWFRTLADYDNLDLIKQPLEALLNRFKNEPKNIINDAICLLFRKSDSIDTLKDILKNSMDTLVQYANNAKTQWISKLDTYNNVMIQNYNPELWHNFEKEIQDFKTKRNATKGKELSIDDKNTLYDTLYKDDNWGLYVPKSFEGDSELASHIKEFKSYGETYNKTRWCTAANPYYFDHYSYNRTKPLYVIKYFENGFYTEAWQIAFMDKHIELMDKEDCRDFGFLFKNAPMELFNKIIDKPSESESFIFPLLVKMYNESPGKFDLDRIYSIPSELSTVSDDVKSMVGKNISLEELIDFRAKFPYDRLETLIKGLVAAKEKGYSLRYINDVAKNLGINYESHELLGCLDILEGNFPLEDLKEFKESMGHIVLGYRELKMLLRLKEKGYSLEYIGDAGRALGRWLDENLEKDLDLIKGNFSLEELKKFRESIEFLQLGYNELKALLRLKEKGYSLEYIGDAIIALGLVWLNEDLEKDLDLIKRNFSLEELKKFRESIRRYKFLSDDLEILVRLKEKGYSLDYLSEFYLSHVLTSFEDLEHYLKFFGDSPS